MEIVFEFGTVAGDFESEVAVLTGLLYFVELFERGFLRGGCVDLFDWWLDEFPRELTWESVALNDHTESISGKLLEYAELIIILKQARYVIAGVVIKRYINPIAVVDSGSVCTFGHNHNGEAFAKTDYIVVDRAVLVAEVMVGFD